MPSSPCAITDPIAYPAGAAAEDIDFDFVSISNNYFFEAYYYGYPELQDCQQYFQCSPSDIVPDYRWAMGHDHNSLSCSNWSDVGLTGLPCTPDDYPIPREYHDSDFGIDAKQQQQPDHLLLCGAQLEQGETVVTSIELPPIQSLIDFPWTPVGVELPPLKISGRKSKNEFWSSEGYLAEV